jgi:hypothetical protein
MIVIKIDLMIEVKENFESFIIENNMKVMGFIKKEIIFKNKNIISQKYKYTLKAKQKEKTKKKEKLTLFDVFIYKKYFHFGYKNRTIDKIFFYFRGGDEALEFFKNFFFFFLSLKRKNKFFFFLKKHLKRFEINLSLIRTLYYLLFYNLYNFNFSFYYLQLMDFFYKFMYLYFQKIQSIKNQMSNYNKKYLNCIYNLNTFYNLRNIFGNKSFYYKFLYFGIKKILFLNKRMVIKINIKPIKYLGTFISDYENEFYYFYFFNYILYKFIFYLSVY